MTDPLPQRGPVSEVPGNGAAAADETEAESRRLDLPAEVAAARRAGLTPIEIAEIYQLDAAQVGRLLEETPAGERTPKHRWLRLVARRRTRRDDEDHSAAS
jgi:hypothetical protein